MVMLAVVDCSPIMCAYEGANENRMNPNLNMNMNMNMNPNMNANPNMSMNEQDEQMESIQSLWKADIEE